MKKKKRLFNIFMLLCALALAFTYGIMVGKYQFFPYSVLKSLQDGTEEVVNYNINGQAYSSEKVEKLIKVKSNNRDSLQQALKKLVLGENLDIDTIYVPAIIKKDDSYFTNLKNLNEIEEFVVQLPNQMESIGYIFHPKESNERLVIYHQGHSGGFDLGKNSISFFVNKGFTVYAFSMPLKGMNNHPIVNLKELGQIQLYNHEELKYLDNPLQYFIKPVIQMIDYSERYNFKDISMVGISGGGWTTTVVSAMDDRIKNSFPVAGTLPLFVKFQEYSKNYGDLEQTYQPMLSKINYLDMYVLGSTGGNRKQIQILNKYDPCCFNGEGYKQYASIVSNIVKRIDGTGNFQVLSDTLNKRHDISDSSLDRIWNILKDER